MMTTSFAFLTSSASNLSVFSRRATQLWELALTFGVDDLVRSHTHQWDCDEHYWRSCILNGWPYAEPAPLGTAVTFVSQVGGAALFALGKQKMLLAFAAVNLCINGGMNLVLIPRYGANGAAISYLVSSASGAVISIVWLVHLGAMRLRARGILTRRGDVGWRAIDWLLAMNLSSALRVVCAVAAGSLGLAILQFKEIRARTEVGVTRKTPSQARMIGATSKRWILGIDAGVMMSTSEIIVG